MPYNKITEQCLALFAMFQTLFPFNVLRCLQLVTIRLLVSVILN